VSLAGLNGYTALAWNNPINLLEKSIGNKTFKKKENYYQKENMAQG